MQCSMRARPFWPNSPGSHYRGGARPYGSVPPTSITLTFALLVVSVSIIFMSRKSTISDWVGGGSDLRNNRA
jgi:hypothetical protein